MRDKAKGDLLKSEGEVSDGHAQQPEADDRLAVQSRAFTRWMNAWLQKCEPPVEVHDLFTDIQDGRVLMALLEELSGCKLLYRFRSSSHRIFRLNNISKALAFLDDRHVKLLGIDASSIVDGVPSVVLNLIWNIILHFQVKEVTGGLQRRLSSSLSSLSMSGCPSCSDLAPQLNDFSSHSCINLAGKVIKTNRKPKYQGKAIKTLLQWAQSCTLHLGVEVHDFGKSWRSGLAFLAMIKSINPALVDLRKSLSGEPKENIRLAFNIAHHSLDIPPLLEPEDVLCSSPDEKSIITYVSMFLMHCSGMEENHKKDSDVPGIPSFGSLESITFGDIDANEPEAKALLRDFERSSEHRLWRRWARRSSGSPRSDLSSSCGDIFSTCRSQSTTENLGTSGFIRKRGKYKPPSPLNAGISSQEIRSWMEKAPAGPRMDENRFSLSSDEGIYNLSALDSDEEEAYSYILELNEEESKPYNQLRRKVPRVEEETEEEMLLNGQQTEESKHLEVYENLKDTGCQTEGHDFKLEVRARSEGRDKCDWCKNKISSKEMAKNGAVCHKEMGSANLETYGFDKTRVLLDETKGRKLSLEEKAREEGPFEKFGQRGPWRFEDKKMWEEKIAFKERQDREVETEIEEVVKDERREKQTSVFNEESLTGVVNKKILLDDHTFEIKEASKNMIKETGEGTEGREKASKMDDCPSEDEDDTVSDLLDKVLAGKRKDSELQIERQRLTKVEEATMAHHGYLENNTKGGFKVNRNDNFVTPAGSSKSFRSGGFALQPVAASCDITPLELEALLVLWMLLFCYFILPQINL